MNVFISWSGSTSKEIAQVLNDWLPSVVQAIKPYFSPVDIDKGTRWNGEINKELESTDVGLLILTRDNINAPWVLFEAGSLAKRLDKSRVCPILFDIEPTDIKMPLAMFQTTSFIKEDMFRLMETLNDALGENKLTTNVLESVYDKWWPDLQASVDKIHKSTKRVGEPKLRSDRDLLDEILLSVRALRQEPLKSAFQSDSAALKNIRNQWGEFIDVIRNQKISVGTILSEVNVSDVFDGKIILECPSDFHSGTIKRNQEFIENNLKNYYGTNLNILIKRKDANN